MRVGVYGGSFDPIHNGHLGVAAEVLPAFDLDEVRFVPARQSPLRQAPRASAEDRLRMCELAVAGRQGFSVSRTELDRRSPSYTVDTLREMRQQGPADELFLIVGTDILADFAAWRSPAAVIALATIIAVTRPSAQAEIPGAVQALGGDAAARVIRHPMRPIAVSSSSVRAAIADGRSIEADVPAAVAGYIETHGLYGARPAHAAEGM